MGTTSSNTRSSIFYRTNFTADADPNTLLPAMPAGVVPNGKSAPSVEGVPFTIPDWYFPHNGQLMLAMRRTANGNTTATVNVWIYDGTSASWVLIKSGLTIAEGTPQFVTVGGPYYSVFVQVTNSTNTPAGLLGFWATA